MRATRRGPRGSDPPLQHVRSPRHTFIRATRTPSSRTCSPRFQRPRRPSPSSIRRDPSSHGNGRCHRRSQARPDPKVEQLILFPTDMGFVRLAPDHPEKVTRIFGHKSWIEIFEARTSEEIAAEEARGAYVRMYAEGLERLGLQDRPRSPDHQGRRTTDVLPHLRHRSRGGRADHGPLLRPGPRPSRRGARPANPLWSEERAPSKAVRRSLAPAPRRGPTAGSASDPRSARQADAPQP